MNILLHPCYFGPISEFVAIAHSKKLIFEKEDHFQKQTYRNRMYVYGANGRLSLNIPIKHAGSKKQHQKYKEVRIENEFSWQKQHWKSLQTAYRSSPFFEFYEDEFQPLYSGKFNYLLDFNLKCFELAMDCLQLEIEIGETREYFSTPENMKDARFLVNAKTEENFELKPYTQVFQNKNDFLPNLSVVDLIFNEGPNALHYLEHQKMMF